MSRLSHSLLIVIVVLFARLGMSEPRAIDQDILSGEWEFYWNQRYTPSDFKGEKQLNAMLVEVPNSWTVYKNEDGENYQDYGFATYRKVVTVENSGEDIAVYIPKIWSASKVWINGDLVSERGVLDAQAYENKILETLVNVGKVNSIEVIVQAANYSLFVSGIIEPFIVGDYEGLSNEINLDQIFSVLWIGAVLVMAFYHFVLFFFRRKSDSALYFGIICLLIGIKQTVFGSHDIYEYLKTNDILNFRWQSAFYYISTYALAPVGLYYMKSLYPSLLNTRVVKYTGYGFSVYALFLLVFPLSIYLPTILPFQLIVFAAGFYIAYVIVRAYFKKLPESKIQLVGILVMILAGINDAIATFGIHLTGNHELIPVAFGILLILQFIILSKRFSGAMSGLEDLSAHLEQKVIDRTAEVNRQKEEIAIQNTNIKSSIRYAERIQKSMMPSLDNFKRILPDSFLLFRPKDVVSGDFYFVEEYKENGMDLKFVAAVDCTGHGVPGALMSMIGSTRLQSIINDYKIFNPSNILAQLTKSLSDQLQQDQNDNRDGMDLAICVIDYVNKEIRFAGAFNPLIYIKDGELIRIKGDRIHVGGGLEGESEEFQEHVIPMDGAITLYLFSDGFQDQLGGPDNKKFMAKKFREMLLTTHQTDMNAQGEQVNKILDDWMVHEEQVDDILLIGLRV